MSSLSIPLEGLNRAETQLNGAAARVASDGPSVENSLNLIQAANDSASNVRAAKVLERMQKPSFKQGIDMYA